MRVSMWPATREPAAAAAGCRGTCNASQRAMARPMRTCAAERGPPLTSFTSHTQLIPLGKVTRSPAWQGAPDAQSGSLAEQRRPWERRLKRGGGWCGRQMGGRAGEPAFLQPLPQRHSSAVRTSRPLPACLDLHWLAAVWRHHHAALQHIRSLCGGIRGSGLGMSGRKLGSARGGSGGFTLRNLAEAPTAMAHGCHASPVLS